MATNKELGRPTTIGGTPVKAYLDPRSQVEADRIGKGNTSAGIRLALKVTQNMTLGEINKIVSNAPNIK